MTVLSAQVTQACCPYEDPNCGVPTTCDPKCAPVFENFWTSCQSFIDVRASAFFFTPFAPFIKFSPRAHQGPELEAFYAKCQAAGGHGGGRGGRN